MFTSDQPHKIPRMPQPAAPVKPQADEARYQGFNFVNNNDRNIICIYNLSTINHGDIYIYIAYTLVDV